MKIATNVSRDAFGGITISNLVLFDWLRKKEDTIVGIEIITGRHLLGASIFRHYPPSFFSHHIINAIDILPKYSWEKWGRVEKKWRVLIDTAKMVLTKESPDILLINGTYNVPWILTQAATELGIPMVLRYAGVLEKEVAHKKYFVRKRLLAYERDIATAAPMIIFPSAVCKKVVEDDIICHPAKHSVIIPNPATPPKKIKRRQSGRYAIAAIGRWTPIKNFGAFVSVHNELLSSSWPHRAVIITSHWDKRFPIPTTVEQQHSMSHEELLKFYTTVDLVIVPSHFETFCNVAAEAIMCGTSVLVSKNVGISEVLRKAGLTRMVIDSFDNPVTVAAAVKRLAKTKLTKTEIDKVTSLLEPQIIHERILKVLNAVLAGNT